MACQLDLDFMTIYGTLSTYTKGRIGMKKRRLQNLSNLRWKSELSRLSSMGPVKPRWRTMLEILKGMEKEISICTVMTKMVMMK
jgi:hypothetical protein